MRSVTITHPLALDATPDEPLPTRVTVHDEGTRHRVRVDPETGTFDGTADTVHRLAEQWGVDVADLTDDERVTE